MSFCQNSLGLRQFENSVLKLGVPWDVYKLIQNVLWYSGTWCSHSYPHSHLEAERYTVCDGLVV